MTTMKVFKGKANCTTCGKSHKLVFEINGLPYGSTCASNILNRELTAPAWLYDLAEEYIEDCVKHHRGNSFDLREDNPEDFANGLWDHLLSFEIAEGYGKDNWNLTPYEEDLKVKKKRVNTDQQKEIAEYLKGRFPQVVVGL